MTFFNELINKIQEMQVLLMISGGSLLNIEIDKHSFDILSIEAEKMMRYVNQVEDRPTDKQITLYGPMCKTIIRVKND
jgi:hypothetical protein